MIQNQQALTQDFSIRTEFGAGLPLDLGVAKMGPGFAADLRLGWQMPFQDWLELQFAGGYSGLTITATDMSLSMIDAGLGLGARIALDPLLLRVEARAGLYQSVYGVTAPQYGGSAMLAGGISLQIPLASGLDLSTGIEYGHYFSGSTTFLAQLRPWAGVSLNPGLLGQARQGNFGTRDIYIREIFPSLYKLYEFQSFGSLTLISNEGGELRDLKATLTIPGHSKAPRLLDTRERLTPGEPWIIELSASFDEDILAIDQPVLAKAVVQVSAFLDGVEIRFEYGSNVRIHDANSLVWDDDRKAAVFVNSKDPLVLKMARLVNSEVRSHPGTAFNHRFASAMSVFQALSDMGLRYASSPNASYSWYLENAAAVDTVQLPRQTLAWKGGDCSDLTILYCALLESMGIDTAFVTVPGHILPAIALDMDARVQAVLFPERSMLIEHQGRYWLPVEVTLLGESFAKACDAGIKAWQSHPIERRIYTLRESWARYEAISPRPDPSLTAPSFDPDKCRTFLSGTFDPWIQERVKKAEQILLEQIRKAPKNPALYNAAGLLHARFGNYEQAKAYFQQGIALNHAPCLLNQGNLALLKGSTAEAEALFARAKALRPAIGKAIVPVFSGDGSRAIDASTMIWVED